MMNDEWWMMMMMMMMMMNQTRAKKRLQSFTTHMPKSNPRNISTHSQNMSESPVEYHRQVGVPCYNFVTLMTKPSFFVSWNSKRMQTAPKGNRNGAYQMNKPCPSAGGLFVLRYQVSFHPRNAWFFPVDRFPVESAANCRFISLTWKHQQSYS